jgi:hypothetical protein
MLVSPKLVADFSRGCALSAIRPALLLTHPTLPFVDRFMPVLTASKQVSASHRSECIFIAPYLVVGNKLHDGELAILLYHKVRLCRIVDTTF